MMQIERTSCPASIVAPKPIRGSPNITRPSTNNFRECLSYPCMSLFTRAPEEEDNELTKSKSCNAVPTETFGQSLEDEWRAQIELSQTPIFGSPLPSLGVPSASPPQRKSVSSIQLQTPMLGHMDAGQLFMHFDPPARPDHPLLSDDIFKSGGEGRNRERASTAGSTDAEGEGEEGEIFTTETYYASLNAKY